MDTQYSNLFGDFIVTPTVSTKELVFSNVELPLVLTPHTFIDFSVKRKRGSHIEQLPVDDVTFTGDTITLNDMTDTFQADDLVSVAVTGMPRGFFVASENTVKEVVNVANKLVIGPEYAGTPFQAVGTASVLVISAESQLEYIWVHNNDPAIAYLQIHDRSTAPTTGNVPYFWEPLQANSITRLDKRLYLTTGLALGISSTKATFTAVTTPSNFDLGGLYL